MLHGHLRLQRSADASTPCSTKYATHATSPLLHKRHKHSPQPRAHAHAPAHAHFNTEGPLIGKVGWYIIILAVPALCTIVLSACCAVALYARHKELKQLEVLSNGNLMGGGRRAESPRAKRKRVRSTESPLLEPDKDGKGGGGGA